MVDMWRSMVLVPMQWIAGSSGVLIFLLLLTANWAQYWVDYYVGQLQADPLPEYDFIVVGGGSAGAVVASRLSEDGKHSVLLLEAGGYPSSVAHIPPVVALLQSTPLNWNYFTEPQVNGTKSLKGQKSHWPRGKVLGGSSVLNYMMYVRGNRLDYDHWSELGNEGWSYDDVLPYFMKSENNRGTFIDETFHGRGGPVTIEDRRWLSQLAEGFVGAGIELGYAHHDINGYNQTGFVVPQVFMNNGWRSSTYAAFLTQPRANLFIATHALVEKILIDDSNRAYGVQYRKHGHQRIVRARKEIVLSAGTVGSAQILMLSGVGPKDHLESLGIPVKSDRKVGFNLQDHLVFMYGPLIHDDDSASWKSPFTPNRWWNYFMNSEGEFTSNSIDGTAFISSTLSSRRDWPDLQMLLLSMSIATDRGKTIFNMFNIVDDYWSSFYESATESDTATIPVILVRPKSRGRIQLRSTDPADHPKIDPRYLSHPDDAKVMLEGIRFAELIAKSSSMQKLNVTMYPTPYPPCKDHPMGSDPYWQCYIDQASYTIYHPVGTCKMGPESDPDAVVDPQLRVYGVKGLRVADASIMPDIVNGNTNAPCIMIGEKVADMILRKWQQADAGERKSFPVKEQLVDGAHNNEEL